MSSLIRPASVLLIILTLITGVAYPLVVTGIARVAFPDQAGGRLIFKGGKAVGSHLIGQSFTDPRYFWGRPSATSPQPYNALASSASNQGPLNPALVDAARARIEALHAADPANTAPIPVDLVTASASGLDPEISVAAANYQADRVARARAVPAGLVRTLISSHAQGRWQGFIGEPRINVLELNLALDDLR